MAQLTPEQIEQRARGVGASEAAQALGLSQWGTAYDLWLKKRGEAEEPESSERLHMGHLLEPVIARIYESENAVHVVAVEETYQHPEFPWLMATPDYRVIERPVLLECKNVNAFRKKEFGEAGGDEIPMDILAQCLAQLAVMQPLVNVNRVDVGVLFGGNEFMQFAVHYDKGAVERLIERMAEFWQCVETGRAPAPQSLKDVRRMFTRDVGRVVEASQPIAGAVEQLRNIRAQMKKAEEIEESLLLAIQSHMQDASTLILPTGEIACTWKAAKDSMTFDREAFKSAEPDHYEQYVFKKPGSRRFLLKV